MENYERLHDFLITLIALPILVLLHEDNYLIKIKFIILFTINEATVTQATVLLQLCRFSRIKPCSSRD